tara:strand:- start:880 stop:7260 length:6381 start_codon:yes stop_codon:yes gene_type:complete
MATTRLEYTGDGSKVTFNLGTIDLINRSDLKVYIFEPSRDSNTAVLQAEATNAGTAGTSHSQYDASNTSGSAAGSIAATTPVNNYQFNSGNTQITLNTDNGVAAPTANAIISLERITSEVQSDFSSQGTIRASELNSELRRIQHIAEEGINEAKLSIKESKFSTNAVDVAHPVSGIDRRIEHVADADSDDDAVNREQLRKVIFDDLIEGEGINLTDATGGTNSNGQTTISGEDSSKTNKGIVKINEGEAIDVNYTAGDAVISAENSTKSNKGVLTVNSGHGVKVGPSDESDAGYDGNVVISADRSTASAQGIAKINQVSGDAINVTHAVNGTVGDISIGVDRSTTSQQGVVRVQSSVPITTTYTSDGEVSLSIPDNTVDLAKIRNDDVITSAELNASTATSNYPSVDWDSDDSIATGKALAKRFDAIYYSHTTNKGTAPTETNWTEGKLWYDHLNDQTLSIWDKTGANTGVWRPITSGGTFTSQPKVVYVDSVNGSDTNDGHRIIRAKKTIRGALLDVNENITSTTTTNVTAATYNHETGLLTVTTDANHNLRVGMKLTMSGLVWSCNYGGGTNNHTFPEADDPVRYVSSILSNTEFESQLEPTVTAGLAHTYVSGGTVTNQAGRVGQGWMITVAAGTYQEVLPLRVEAENVSIVGTTMRSCFIHPSNSQRYDTSKDFNASDAVIAGTSEYNTMFEMNSGTYIWGFAFSGLKAGGWTTSGGSTASARGAANGYVPEANRNEQRTNVDPDSTYGLPPVQGWVAAFRPNCSLKKSPYIQNCTSISDTDINNAGYDPTTTTGGLGGDKDSGMTGGGILVDGSVPSATSPLRSFVVDAFTQINMDGPGILCTNNGYAQLVSFFGTFCHYHAKSLNGGMLNLANCTTDYGRYGLIADGKSSTTTFTSTVDGAKAAGQTSFNIDATTLTSGYFGTGFNNTTTNLRPGDNYLVSIGSDTYEIVSATPVGGSWTATSGWTVNIMKTNATNPAINDGLANAITDGATVNFYQRSYVSTGGHTFEYVGAGTDYRAAPENGGVPVEANEVINRNMGKVWQSSTNHVGKFKVGETFVIDQRSGKVESKGITLTGPVTTNNNDNITIDPAGSGTVTVGSALGVTGNLTVNTGNITTASNADITLTPNGSGKVVIDALNWPTADGTANYYLQTNGSGQLQWAAAASTSNPTISNPTVTGNLVVTDNLRLNDDDDSNHITITAPSVVGTDMVLTLPATAPTANQYLKAGASTPGNLVWENQLAITSVYTAANESAQLGLTTQEGDVVIRSDLNKTYIRNAGTAGSMADFTELASPTGGVTSWAGSTGVISTSAAKSAIIGTGETFVKLDINGSLSNSGSNTYAGYNAGDSLGSDTIDNTLYGKEAGKSVTTGGKGNTFIGAAAGENTTDGSGNIAIGRDSFRNNASGDTNIIIGDGAADLGAFTGSNNIVIGANTDPTDASTSNEITLGNSSVALFRVPGVGLHVRDTNSTTNLAIGNVFTGQAMASDHSTIVGYNAGVAATGGNSTFFGSNAGNLSTGADNTALGQGSLEACVGGGDNTAVGRRALNTVDSGEKNVGVGKLAGDNITSGNNNIVIGTGADASSATVDNEITLGDSNITKFRIPGLNFTVKDSTATEDYVLTLDANGEAGWEAVSTPAPAGPEVTATASGTIADKGAVIVNSDGTVSAVSQDAAVTGSIVAESSSNGGNSTMAYDTANGKVVHVYVHSNNLYGRVGTTNTNGSLSWGSEVSIWTGSGSAGYPDIAFASDTGVFYLFYRRWTGNDSRGYVAKIVVSGTSFSTSQTTQVVPQDGPEHGCIALDNDGGGMIVWKSNISGENNRLKANVLTFGSSASSISAGSRQEVNTGNTANYPSVAYDPANDNYCICWENNSMSGRFTVIKATVAGTSSITFQGTNNINSVLSRETQVVNIGAGKFLGLYARKGSDDIRGTIITMNADNTISFSSATTIYTTAGSGDVNMMNNNCLVKVDYLTDTYAVLMMDYGSSSKGVLQFFTASGSTITPTDTIQLWPNGLNNPALLYDPDKKLLVTAGRDANNSYYISSRIYRKAQSNADANNFLGFASAGYSNGNTATIKVVGNTVTGLSGLTAGKKYYVQGNGTLGTTSTSVEAGISLTSSSLLIR